MFRISFLCFLVASALAEPILKEETFETHFVHNGILGTMQVEVSPSQKTIKLTMPRGESFDEVISLQDYDMGFVASRVEAEDSCYLHMLRTNMVEDVEHIKNNHQKVVTTQSEIEIKAMPLEEDDDIGETLLNFCDDLQMMKLVVPEDEDVVPEPKAEIEMEEKRHFRPYYYGAFRWRYNRSTFRSCRLFRFWPVCFYTTFSYFGGTDAPGESYSCSWY